MILRQPQSLFKGKGVRHNMTAGLNLSKVALHNRRLLLDIIRREGPLSRLEIARNTQLSPGTVSNLSGELLDMNLIREYSGSQRRRISKHGSVPLQINPDAKLALGIDMGKSSTLVVLADLLGEIRVSETTESFLDREPDIAIREVRSWVEKRRLLDHPLAGIGVSVHGPIDRQSNIVSTVPYFPKWERAPIRELFGDIFGRRDILFGNDTRLAAYASTWWGSGRRLSSFSYFKVGTCVGGATVTDGKLHQGLHYVAGEFGHITVEPRGPQCECGNHGCLELYSSARGIVSHFEARQESLSSHANVGVDRSSHAYFFATLEAIAKEAERGVPSAIDAIDRAAEYLAIGVLNTIYVTDPQAIIINWEPQSAKALFIARLAEHLKRRAFSHIADRIEVLGDTLERQSSALGAATLHLARVYESPEEHRAVA